MVSNKKPRSKFFLYLWVWTCFIDSKDTIRKIFEDLRDGTVVKSNVCCCRDTEPKSQHPDIGPQLSIIGSDAPTGLQMYMQQSAHA